MKIIVPSNKTIEQRAREIIANELALEIEKVTPEASFKEDLGADSLDAIEIVMAIEEEFEIDINDEDSEKMATVGDMLAYLNAQAARQASGE